MLNSDILQIIIFLVVLVFLAVPLGTFIGKVLNGEKHILLLPFGWIEKFLYKLMGVDPSQEMDWKSYTKALLLFHFWGFLFLMGLQYLQPWLPLNPQNLPSVPGWLAFNTAVSFITNTNWQAYSGESQMSYLTQMAGLAVQNFLSAAKGMAVIVVIARGLSRKSTKNLSNFWVDCTRIVLYILLPLSIVWTLGLMHQGVVQNFSSYITAETLEGVKQVLPMGPAASQIAIKQLGSNGGGFFGVNSAHPFENPTPFSNFLEMLAILLIPFSLPFAFGRMVGNKQHGRALFAAMFFMFAVSLLGAIYAEYQFNPVSGLGFWEGKEQRFGIGNSVLWTIATTVTSNGSVNAMISSMAPLTGGLALLNLMLGEVVFGGVGSGLYGMVLFVILTVFIAGLMVGRTPEYLGKKIEAPEIKLAVIGVLIPSLVILLFSAFAIQTDLGLSSLSHKGPHGLSEILYTFSSAAANNGSAFAGLNANTNFYNILTAVAMLIGRFAVMIPVLAIAGNLAAKKQTPPSPGTFPTEGPIFVALLISVVIIVGALTFFPALTLGPIIEHFLMLSERTF